MPDEKLNSIISGLQYTMSMICFNPSTGEIKDPAALNEADKTTYDACLGAVAILAEQDEKIKQLYDYIYAHYAEMKELNEMTDESLLLDIDILEIKYEKAFAELDAQLAELDSALAEKDSALAEKDSALAEKDSALAEKDMILADKETALQQALLENERLKAELSKLSNR